MVVCYIGASNKYTDCPIDHESLRLIIHITLSILFCHLRKSYRHIHFNKLIRLIILRYVNSRSFSRKAKKIYLPEILGVVFHNNNNIAKEKTFFHDLNLK